jgi:transposase-like protein
MVVENTNRDTILPIISQFVEEGSTVFTDELNSYNRLADMGYDHKICNHGQLQYVVEARCTQTTSRVFGVISDV